MKKNKAQGEFWEDTKSSPSLGAYALTATERLRLESSFEIGQGGCWNWRGGTNAGGYGNSYLRGRAMVAHRLMYILANGEVPPGMLVLHRCDNRRCGNPFHLSLGTCMENVADMMRKGRHASMRKKKLKSKRK